MSYCHLKLALYLQCTITQKITSKMKAIPSAPPASPGIKRVKEAIIYFYQVNKKLGSFTFFLPHASLRKKLFHWKV